jgi:hypothetical protein
VWKTTTVQIGRCEGECVRQPVHQVSARHPRRLLPGQLRSRAESAQPVLGVRTGPDQRAQPGPVVGVGRVERIQVDADTRHHVRQPTGQGHAPGRGAGEVDRTARADRSPVVLVAVSVGIQAEPGGGSHLDERERPVQPRQDREQGRAPGRFVGLGGPDGHDRPQPRAVVDDPAAEVPAVRGSPLQVLHRGEEQVRLALAHRQRGEELQDVRIVRDVGREPGVDGRGGGSLIDERAVALRDPAQLVVGHAGRIAG